MCLYRSLIELLLRTEYWICYVYSISISYTKSISISISIPIISISIDKNDDLLRRDGPVWRLGTSQVGYLLVWWFRRRLHGSTVHHLTPLGAECEKKQSNGFFSQPKTVKALPKNRCFLHKKLKGESTVH